MNEGELGVLNSGLVLNYILNKKSVFTLYLDDGAKLTGTLLGWDADFLLIQDGGFLQMVRLGNVTRLQAELEQVITVDKLAGQNKPNRLENESRNSNPSPPDVLSNFKPTLTEVKTTSSNFEKRASEERSDPKNRLDQLIKNW